MAHFWRWKGASITAAICAAMLSSPCAVAGATLFGMAVSGPGATPVAIDPTTGIMTPLTSPLLTVTGNAFDVVSSANTLYMTTSANPSLLISVNETTGVQGPIRILTLPSGVSSVFDMTVAITGAPTVPEPSTWAMMLLGFAGLGFAFRQSRRKIAFA